MMRGARERQARAAGAERDEEHVDVAALEGVDLRVAILRVAREERVLDALLIEPTRDELQHRRELREDEDVAPLAASW
ncbi:MAG: hypothetical protein U0235_30705 [Polyangiaceae bacterium]